MESLGDAVLSASLWIGAVLGAIFSVLAQFLWDSQLSRRFRAWRSRARSAADTRRGRAPSIGRSRPIAGKVLPEYFRQQEENIDLAIYELSLSPKVPVMDLLYLEYLRGRLEDGSIGEVVVVPWSGWRDDQNDDGERLIQAHLRRVFGKYFDRVTVVTASMLQEEAESVFENHFFEQVGNLGNSEFLRNASSVMGYQFRSYHDINQGHPETHQARSIVEHTVRGWLIYKYIEREYIRTPNPPRQIGSLMWERELTKLLLLSNIVENYEIDCSLMLGSSVTYRRGLRSHPLPTFEKRAVNIFADERTQYPILARATKAELRRTNEVLGEILASRKGLRDLPGWAGDPQALRATSGLRGEALGVAMSLKRVHAMYGV